MGKRRRLPARLVVEIGERDGWLCGICYDAGRPVTSPARAVSSTALSRLRPEDLVFEDVPPGEEARIGEAGRDPLAASIDHIVPVSAGGTDEPRNLQIAHLFCNLHKNNSRAGVGFARPDYVRGVLANLIDGTPVPEDIHRGCSPRWAYPAGRRTELMIALYIAAGEVAADPRYGDPAARSDPFMRELGRDRWQDAVANVSGRRARWRARWKLSNPSMTVQG
jgi:hypothetical protein